MTFAGVLETMGPAEVAQAILDAGDSRQGFAFDVGKALLDANPQRQITPPDLGYGEHFSLRLVQYDVGATNSGKRLTQALVGQGCSEQQAGYALLFLEEQKPYIVCMTKTWEDLYKAHSYWVEHGFKVEVRPKMVWCLQEHISTETRTQQ